MHRLQVVHRDLKPSNLMVTMHPESSDDATLRILDFGLARLAGENALGSRNHCWWEPHDMSPSMQKPY